MKKTLCALAVVMTASPVPLFAAEASVYGSIRLVAHSPAEGEVDIDNSSSRFGLKGSEQVGNLTVGGHYEFGIQADKAQVMDQERLSYISISGGFGELQVGRVWSTYWNANEAAWPHYDFGGDGNSTTFRLSDAAKWTHSFGNITTSGLLVLDDGHKRTQGSVAYNTGGAGVTLGFDQSIGGGATKDGSTEAEDRTEIALGLSYSLNSGVTVNTIINSKDDGVNGATVGYHLNGVYSDNNNTFILSYGDGDTDADDTETLSFELERTLGESSAAWVSTQNSSLGTGVKIGLKHDW